MKRGGTKKENKKKGDSRTQTHHRAFVTRTLLPPRPPQIFSVWFTYVLSNSGYSRKVVVQVRGG